MTQPQTLFDFEATSLAGEHVDLSKYDGQVVLVVNTASACGFTPQTAMRGLGMSNHSTIA